MLLPLVSSALLSAILLTGCNSEGNWKHSQIEGSQPGFRSSRLSYASSGRYDEMKLEVIRKKEICKGYLSVGSKIFTPLAGNEKQCEIRLTIEGETDSYSVPRYKGGHRLLLPDDVLQRILSRLEKGCEVSIQTSGYELLLEPEGFASLYEKFQKHSKVPRLIRPPF